VLEGGRLGTDVDSLDPGGDVVQDCGRAESVDQDGVGPGPLVTRDVESGRLAPYVCGDRVEVGRLPLVGQAESGIRRRPP
jgi:hypothetical protein